MLKNWGRAAVRRHQTPRRTLQRLRQIRTRCPAPVIPIDCHSLGTVTGNVIEEIYDPAIVAMLIDEAAKPVVASSVALVASNSQHIEPADQVTEDDCASAGHGGNHRTASAIINAAPGNWGRLFVTPSVTPTIETRT
jgi:hypothetical protein